MYVVVAGNVGAGKSTLCEALAGRLSLPLLEEPWRDNPHLEAAYADPAGHRAAAQAWFWEAALEQHRRAIADGGVHDRGVDEHHLVFAAHYRELGYVDDATWGRLEAAYAAHRAEGDDPDVLVYLRVDPDRLLDRIAGRGREMETAIDEPLLRGLHERLERMVDEWDRSPVIVVDPYPIERLDDVVELLAEPVESLG